jgi:hypothetical protein
VLALPDVEALQLACAERGFGALCVRLVDRLAGGTDGNDGEHVFPLRLVPGLRTRSAALGLLE